VIRRGAKNLSLFHRLGIALVILGMVHSLAPSSFRPTRSSLRLPTRLQVAPTFLGDIESSPALLLTEPTLPSQAGANRETDQESHDTEDVAEAIAWPLAMTDRRSAPGEHVAAATGSIARPGRREERTLSALQRSRSLTILSTSSCNMTIRLCRLAC